MLLRSLPRRNVARALPSISRFVPLRHASTSIPPSSSTEIEIADPLLLYFSLVAQEKIKKDDEQLRALVQVRMNPRSSSEGPGGLFPLIDQLAEPCRPHRSANCTRSCWTISRRSGSRLCSNRFGNFPLLRALLRPTRPQSRQPPDYLRGPSNVRHCQNSVKSSYRRKLRSGTD